MYIFGYGSLMNSESRKLTGQTDKAIPAVADGLVRRWGKIDDSYTLSPLVVSTGDGQVNGVLLEISPEVLPEFDCREKGYRRIELCHSQISAHAELDPSRTVWVYVNDSAESPCPNVPIMQSYVDTVLAGCLEVSAEFAQHFTLHTEGWHHPLENDRHAPKYRSLAGVCESHHQLIDEIVASVREPSETSSKNH